MTDLAAQLLKRLEPTVRPGLRAAPRQPLEERNFDELLQLVSHGQVRSGREVTIDFTPDAEITDDQRERLAAAADLAEAEGARSALMLVDGRGVLMDVADRRLTEELTSTSVVARIDAAVYVAGPDDKESVRPIGPDAGAIPARIAHQLEAARG
ncbi:MAG: hypothetical protein ACYTF9_10200, partial [Planctomycetota bacterium]